MVVACLRNRQLFIDRPRSLGAGSTPVAHACGGYLREYAHAADVFLPVLGYHRHHLLPTDDPLALLVK